MLQNGEISALPGDRVIVFDRQLYVDDKTTPPSVTMRPGTVVARYGRLKTSYPSGDLGPYADLIDVRFDHRPQDVSHGHFAAFAREEKA